MGGREHQNSEYKNSFSFDLSCPSERYLARVKVRNFSQCYHSGNNICHQHESICDNKHQVLPLGPFLKDYREEDVYTRKFSENAEKRLQVIPTHLWSLHGGMGLQLSHFFPQLLHRTHAKVLKFAAFRDHGWRTG